MKTLKFSLGTMMTNCYFLVDECSNRCAVVDPGDEPEKIIKRLEEKGLTVDAILLTHGHFDHIMALPELKAYTHAPLMLHEDDAPLYLSNDDNCMKRFACLDIDMPKPDRLLREGDAIKIGSATVTLLHTPGHTRGSVCYVFGDDLITGDTLFLGSCGRSDLPGGDYRVLLKSLARLAALPGNPRIFPGHGASSHLDRERVSNPYLAASADPSSHFSW